MPDADEPLRRPERGDRLDHRVRRGADKPVVALRDLIGEVDSSAQLPAAIATLDDADCVALVSGGGRLTDVVSQMCAVGAAVLARRSTRERGVEGAARSRGHRNGVSLVQDLTGATRGDAARQVRAGESILDATGLPEQDRSGALIDGAAGIAGADGPDTPDGTAHEGAAAALPWHAGLTRAHLSGAITVAQLDAIRRGLGEPPTASGSGEAREVWAIAADQLAAEAGQRTVEELIRAARTVRDQLDPEGARMRFEARHEARAFRMYTDAEGVPHAHIVCEEEGYAWLHTIVDAALRPRRGGPRFVDASERAAADDLSADPRSNDQLAYDLIMDVLRAGALADAASVFSTRQAGIRLIQVVESATPPVLEDDGTSLPDWLVQTRSCDVGTVAITVDGRGNPLDVGREHRLFTPRQRVALAVRDGGCRWHDCDRPASYCESHHIDEWQADQGRTDVDRGILLCRYHHMTLHNGGWRITRVGKDDFWLHPLGEARPTVLAPRLARTYLWGNAPPPRRFRPVA